MKYLLKNVTNVRIGYQLRGRLQHDPDGTHRIIQMRDIGPNHAIRSEDFGSFTPKRDPDRYLVGAGDVLFLARGNRNRAYTIPGPCENIVASSHFLIVTPDAQQLLPGYLAWYLNSRQVQAYLKSNAQGTTMMLVSRRVFDSIHIDVPPLKVQSRIVKMVALRRKQRDLIEQLEEKRDALAEAACLNAVDNATTKESMNV